MEDSWEQGGHRELLPEVTMTDTQRTHAQESLVIAIKTWKKIFNGKGKFF